MSERDVEMGRSTTWSWSGRPGSRRPVRRCRISSTSWIGVIRILDLAFVHKNEDGTIEGLDLDAVGRDGDPSLTVFAGVSSGLLGDDDVQDAGGAIEPGCSAALLVYENTWAAPFATALRQGGAQLVANGRIPVNAIIAALDEAEGKE